MNRTNRQARAFLNRLIATTLMFILLLVLVLGTLCVLYQDYCATRICFGVQVHGIALGGLTPKRASERLEQELGTTAPGLVNLYTETEQWTVSNKSLGGTLDLEKAVEEAWQFGRSQGYTADMLTRLHLLLEPYNIEPVYNLQPTKAQALLNQLVRNGGGTAFKTHSWVAGTQTRATSAAISLDIDIAQTCVNIEQAVQTEFGTSGWNKVNIAANDVLKIVPAAIVYTNHAQTLLTSDSADAQLESMLECPLTVSAVFDSLDAQGNSTPMTKTWIVDQATLAGWSELDVPSGGEPNTIQLSLDRDAVYSWVEAIANSIAQPPREGRFHYDPGSGELETLRPGQIGLGINIEASIKAIEKACLTGAGETHLVVNTVPPLVTKEELQALAPLTLISQGETSFYGSSPDRLQNIQVATSCFDGITIPAQSRFSFLDRLGDVTLATGYSESWIIYGDRTILGPGGGVCQVSTTCFRAAFYGGYPIVERHSHSYRVSWYEPPVGLDAAVFSPITDMVFTNDTDTPILVQTIIDENHSKLYFQFYGAPTGRTVKVDGPYLSNTVSAPDPIYVNDPSLPEGMTIQQEYAHDGLDTTISRQVYQDGLMINEDLLESHYEPWAARYLVGTGQ